MLEIRVATGRYLDNASVRPICIDYFMHKRRIAMHESFHVMETRGGEQKWRADNDTLIMSGECRGEEWKDEEAMR